MYKKYNYVYIQVVLYGGTALIYLSNFRNVFRFIVTEKISLFWISTENSRCAKLYICLFSLYFCKYAELYWFKMSISNLKAVILIKKLRSHSVKGGLIYMFVYYRKIRIDVYVYIIYIYTYKKNRNVWHNIKQWNFHFNWNPQTFQETKI